MNNMILTRDAFVPREIRQWFVYVRISSLPLLALEGIQPQIAIVLKEVTVETSEGKGIKTDIID